MDASVFCRLVSHFAGQHGHGAPQASPSFKIVDKIVCTSIPRDFLHDPSGGRKRLQVPFAFPGSVTMSFVVSIFVGDTCVSTGVRVRTFLGARR